MISKPTTVLHSRKVRIDRAASDPFTSHEVLAEMHETPVTRHSDRSSYRPSPEVPISGPQAEVRIHVPSHVKFLILLRVLSLRCRLASGIENALVVRWLRNAPARSASAYCAEVIVAMSSSVLAHVGSREDPADLVRHLDEVGGRN